MIDNLFKDYKIILASRSPRRQQLLSESGISFDVVLQDYTESFPEGLSGKDTARYIADGKAQSFEGKLSEREIVIVADTIVWCNEKLLGKPTDRADAFRMLKEISGNTHEVITAVSLISSVKRVTFTESTKVTFTDLSDEEILYYIDNYHPYDKAGAYGIQEWIGIVACSSIEGSYFNVVGLPVQRLYSELRKFTGKI